MEHLSGFAPLADRFDGFVLDLWGVIHDGVNGFPHAVDCLARLRAAGKRTLLLSNVPRPNDAVQVMMRGMGIADDLYTDILTSGEAVCRALQRPPDLWWAELGLHVFHLGPERDRGEFERAWNELANAAAPRVLTYEPHYEGSPIVFGPPGGLSSASGTHTFKARAGHHLPPQLLSSGRNVFEELGADFTLLAFDAENRAVTAFEKAARKLRVPLKIVRDSYSDGRTAYEAKFILVRPDRYVAWTSDGAPADAGAIIATAVGRG